MDAHGDTLDLARALDNVWGCWPGRRLLAFRLPEGEGFLRVDRGRIAWAAALEASGELRAPRESPVTGLRVEWKAAGVKLHLRARVWSIGAKGELPDPRVSP